MTRNHRLISALEDIVRAQFPELGRNLATQLTGELMSELVAKDDRNLLLVGNRMHAVISEIMRFKPADALGYLNGFFARPPDAAAQLLAEKTTADTALWPPLVVEAEPAEVRQESMEAQRGRIVADLARCEAEYVQHILNINVSLTRFVLVVTLATHWRVFVFHLFIFNFYGSASMLLLSTKHC